MGIICAFHYSWGHSFPICKIKGLDSISQVPLHLYQPTVFPAELATTAFFSPIITCIYRALLTSESFISDISWFSSSLCEGSGREGSIILIWLGKKMRYWEVVTCLMLATKSKLEEPGTYGIIPGFFPLSNMACLSVSSTLFQPRNMKNS